CASCGYSRLVPGGEITILAQPQCASLFGLRIIANGSEKALFHGELMIVVLMLALIFAGCSTNKAAPVTQQVQAAPVLVSKVALKSVPIEIQAVGNVEAYSTVTAKAQVGG